MKNWVILVCCLSFLTCRKEISSNVPDKFKGDKVIFGGVGLFCPPGQDCKNLYLIHDGKVYRDIYNASDKGKGLKNTTFSETPIIGVYELVKDLADVPEGIMNLTYDDGVIMGYESEFIYYIFIEKDGIEKEFQFNHFHRKASREVKDYFQTFLSCYELTCGSILDTTSVHNYY